MTTKVIQADREAAEPFRRGKGGKYDRDQEALAYAFASHADPLRRALIEISILVEDVFEGVVAGPQALDAITDIVSVALNSGENNNGE